MNLESRFISTNGVRYFIKEAGNKNAPLILFLHGFPDSWYSWRHQLVVIAAAGYHAVAPDMLGYGETDAPEEISRYSQDYMAKDIVGLIEALGHKQAILVGHDLGASLTWQVSLLYPEKVKAVVGLSVPYGGRALKRPTDHMKKIFAGRLFYIDYFQRVGVAEKEFDADKRTFLLKFYAAYDAKGGVHHANNLAPEWTEDIKGFLDTLKMPTALPEWLSESSFNYYVSRYQKHGLRPPINWYRCLDEYWERTEHLAHQKVTPPVFFITGKNDPVNVMNRKAIQRMPQFLEDFRGMEMIEDCGHWIACEQGERLSELLLDFLHQLTRK